jgi:flagellar hook-basal body complex protein FliE
MSNHISGIGPQSLPITAPAHVPSAKGSEFMQNLEKTIHQVESLQTDVEKQAEDLVTGQGRDVHSAMIAVEKANLSFQLMMQVRNKIVQAYEEISRMPF